MINLVVSIVAHNVNLNELEKVLSFTKVKYKKIKIKVLIFDNANQYSLKSYCIKNKFIYFRSLKNVGFGSGHNYNIKKTIFSKPIYLILSPDVYLKPKDLIVCLTAINKYKSYGLLSPKLLNIDGSVQLNCRLIPSLLNFIFRFLFNYDNTSKIIHQNIERNNKIKIFKNIPFIHGACYFVKYQVFKKVGLFDENFFLYVEDLDFYRRVLEKFQTIYLKNVKVKHTHGRASKKKISLFLLHVKSIIYYFSKWGIFNDIKRKKINQKFILN